MVEIRENELVFEFPEVHEQARCALNFQRTLRIPDDNNEYALPPGFGNFPLKHVDDHASTVPAHWAAHGGVMLPMYQAEALWISFTGATATRPRNRYPFAIKIAAGKINAVTGQAWTDGLSADPQDYLVVPDQLWLDGFCINKGQIRQFVAMPLGQGYTAEEQINGSAEHCGVQIIAYPMKADYYERHCKRNEPDMSLELMPCLSMEDTGAEMGLAPGGVMAQEIYEDEYGLEAWDIENSSRCFVHILNSEQWQAATGSPAPGSPPSAADYTNAGLPWFDYYNDRLSALDGSKLLSGLDSVAAKGVKKGEKPLKGNVSVAVDKVIDLGKRLSRVRDGNW